MDPGRLLFLLPLLAAGLLAVGWVVATGVGGGDRARRHLGTVRLSLGCLAVVLLIHSLLTLPLAPLVTGGRLTIFTFLLAALATQVPMLLVLYLRIVHSGAASWSELGLRALPLGRVIGQGLLVGIGALALSAIVNLLLSRVGVEQNQMDQFSFVRDADPLQFLLVFLAGTATRQTDGAGAAEFLRGGECRFAFV